MMNAPLPTGLQALLQASQVLQQQSAPTAPGPMGPQPTVASKISQQLDQAAPAMMPGVRDLGQQAGIAGQIMAQKQAQQQQIAQNPQAIAQMAAQMVKGQGVAGLPDNLQFAEGGIIGFDGRTQSDVPDPEEGLSMAERADKLRREKGSIYSPTFGLTPEEAEAYLSDIEAQRQGRANPEMVPVVGGEVPRTESERKRIAENQALIERMRANARAIGASAAARREGIEAASGTGERAAVARKEAEPAAAGAERLEQYYRPYPQRGEMKVTDSGIAAVAPEAQPPANSGAPTRSLAPSPAPQPPAAQGEPTGIAVVPITQAAASPSAEMPTRKGIMETLGQFTTPPEILEAQKGIEALDAEMLAKRKGQEDLESQGIAALKRAEESRQQQLQEARGRDDFSRLRAFFRDLAYRGNSYDAVQTGIAAREAGNTQATLAHEQAVLELKKAKQAREMGDLEMARTHKARALEFLQNERGIKRELAKLDIQTQTQYDKMTADERTAFANRQSTAAIHAADAASREKIANAQLVQQATERKDLRLASLLQTAGAKINEGYKTLESLQDKYGMVAKMPLSPEQLKDPGLKAKYDEYQQARENIMRNVIQPAIRERDRLSQQLGGQESSGNVVRYDSSGKRI